MTNREKTALVFVAVGVALILIAAIAYGGWRAGAATTGALALLVGFALAIDDRPSDLVIEADVPVIDPPTDDQPAPGYPTSVDR